MSNPQPNAPPPASETPSQPPKDGSIIDWYKSSPPISKIPCARNSLIAGVASAVGFGSLRGISGGPLVAMNWAIGSFVGVSMGSWYMCWHKFEEEREQVRIVMEANGRRAQREAEAARARATSAAVETTAPPHA
ncbi:hypothetical protein BD626DRAFT_488369 [Schizophyllum amplum]|uniref:Cytochrome c oxidase assembly protein COX20, mitochondrial n=1 Tax=Schizophyllum amplum TaxID=97359 RepID=A0A550CKK9_9AGAR|nr:hypothetical protein BD626DRAFT_488369 [Auriculariopsis ampla]